MIRVGINGFGRIGKLVFRILCKFDELEVVAINDPFITPDYAKYLLINDTTHGKFECDCECDEKHIIVNGRKILFTSEKEIQNLNWADLGVDYLIECSGKFTKKEDAELHLKQGAKKVIISAPGKNGIPTFVMGVNNDKYTSDMTIISNASCTTNCLAPLAKVIDEEFGIEEGIMTTVHSITASQLVVDGPSKKDWRLGRSGLNNIIPSSTGATKALGEVLPNLKGKLTGCSLRVPTQDVSIVDLTVKLKNATTYENICEKIKLHCDTDMKGIMAYTDDAVVSSDFIGDKHTCIFDASAGIMTSENFVKLFAWYDNEWGYSCKLVDLLLYVVKIDCNK